MLILLLIMVPVIVLQTLTLVVWGLIATSDPDDVEHVGETEREP